jgi:hypothetical protein
LLPDLLPINRKKSDRKTRDGENLEAGSGEQAALKPVRGFFNLLRLCATATFFARRRRAIQRR